MLVFHLAHWSAVHVHLHLSPAQYTYTHSTSDVNVQKKVNGSAVLWSQGHSGWTSPSSPLSWEPLIEFITHTHTQCCYSEGVLRNLTVSFSNLQRWNSPKYWRMWEVNSGGFASEISQDLLISDPALYGYTRNVVCGCAGQAANLN